MHQSLGVPRNTRSKISPSGPSDQLADQANHSRRISSSAIQRFPTVSCTGVPCSRSHRRKFSESLSPLAGDSLSLIRSPISGRLKPPNRYIKVSSLIYKKTSAGFSVFSSLSGRKKAATFVGHPKLQTDDSPSSAIKSRRNHRHQNPPPQIYQNQPFFGQKSRRKFHRLQQ